MPELPEVESVRRSLLKPLVGRRVVRVTLSRPDVVRGDRNQAALLQGATITRLLRHGKQLAIVGQRANTGHSEDKHAPSASNDASHPATHSRKAGSTPPAVQLTGELADEPTVCVHLGMSGSLCQTQSPGANQPRHARRVRLPHTHVVWQLDNGAEVAFRDPRRFGGLWTFASPTALREQRWQSLGEDALRIKPRSLLGGLQRTRRAIKAALLDQGLIAGLGNIYVDELLFAAGIAPLQPADTLDLASTQRLVRQMRRILQRAIEAGGSTLRDYVDGQGKSGGYQSRHSVYGHGGEPCSRCGALLTVSVVAGRTTVHCPACQPASVASVVIMRER